MADAEGLLRVELSEDDLHPNAAGYAIMTPLAESAIQAALRKQACRPARLRRHVPGVCLTKSRSGRTGGFVCCDVMPRDAAEPMLPWWRSPP
jgi:hypothetical protein